MNFRRLTEHELAAFAENIRTLLENGELESIDPATRERLLEAIGSLPSELRAKAIETEIAEDRRKSILSDRNDAREETRNSIGNVRDTLRACKASDGEYALCGFDIPPTRSRYVASDPADLTAYTDISGVNKLKFTGNNRAAQIVYEIWRRTGADGEWAFYSLTRKQSFEDSNVRRALRYEYKVRAIAAKTVSNFSNVTMTGGSD